MNATNEKALEMVWKVDNFQKKANQMSAIKEDLQSLQRDFATLKQLLVQRIMGLENENEELRTQIHYLLHDSLSTVADEEYERLCLAC
ncbi:MAG: hypothetical protein EAZ55_14795 [Cytophagales bacterium]|nr:MAG: hypothetical protein EAZ55_14795 [Cytophagales bacterium]